MLCLQEDKWTRVFTGSSLNSVVFAGESVDSCVYRMITELCCFSGGSMDSCVYRSITELCCVCRRISGLLCLLEDH